MSALKGYGSDPGVDPLLVQHWDDPLIKTVQDWRELRDYLNNPLAELIIERTMNEAAAAINDLMEVDPTDVAKVTVIQQKLLMHRNLGWWLRQVKEQADEAEDTFNKRQRRLVGQEPA